ncbi:MAG: LysR family transcriptional regulator [Magnetospirillum sp.]|nr:LysR family transcriptional regulator [Magnetospirillum sp.]
MSGSDDLAFFAILAHQPSLAAAAETLNLSAPAVSRRLAALERRLGVRLMNRTTRRLSLTPEGQRYADEAVRILADISQLEQDLAAARQVPRGLLRIAAGFGFGRRHLGPAVADFVTLHPEVEVRLHLSDRPLDLAAEGIDIGIRFGLGGDSGLLARKIASNRRLLCAAPSYLARHPAPSTPRDLTRHDCIFIRENDQINNTWKLVDGTTQTSVKVGGRVGSNHGEVAVDWALKGLGILLRSEWDIAPYLRSGELVRVLPQWSGAAADIHAIFQERHLLSAKVKVFLDFLTERFAQYRRDGGW